MMRDNTTSISTEFSTYDNFASYNSYGGINFEYGYYSTYYLAWDNATIIPILVMHFI